MATLAEVWMERGKQEGKLEGKLEGKAEGARRSRLANPFESSWSAVSDPCPTPWSSASNRRIRPRWTPGSTRPSARLRWRVCL